MSTTKSTVIATAKFEYNQDGTLESAALWPKISISKDEIINQMGDCNNKTVEELKNCAQLMLGAFFNKVSEIELRDMENTTLEAGVAKESKYESGNLKEIEIEFIYKQKTENEN